MNWDQQYWAAYGVGRSLEERCATPITDNLLSICGAERLATFHGQPGGEWDHLRLHVSLRTRRSLTGAGWMRLHGMKPDVFCDWIGNSIEWYVDQCRQAIPEQQRANNIARHHRVAERNGHRSYYEHRSAWVRSLGYSSLYAYRKQRGW
jgi:hypothetical protein